MHNKSEGFSPRSFISSASLCEAAQCSHWAVRSKAELRWREAPEGETGRAEPLPYTHSDVPCERPLPLPLGEVAERSEDGEGKP